MREAEQQAALQMKLEEEELEADKIQEKFNNLAEELEYKNEKLMKMFDKFQVVNRELEEINQDFDRERNDMYDTIYELTN